MSFSRNVKEELARHKTQARHCQIAEFAAIFALAGRVREVSPGRYCLEIHTENLTVAQKSDMLLRKMFQMTVDVRVRNHNLQGSTMGYTLVVQKQAMVKAVLKAVKQMDEQGRLLENGDSGRIKLVQNACCNGLF